MLPMRIVLRFNRSEVYHHPPPRYRAEEATGSDGALMATEPDRLSVGEHIGRIVGTIIIISIILLYLLGGARR
jgi:hypothetical protein